MTNVLDAGTGFCPTTVTEWLVLDSLFVIFILKPVDRHLVCFYPIFNNKERLTTDEIMRCRRRTIICLSVTIYIVSGYRLIKTRDIAYREPRQAGFYGIEKRPFSF
jgi:hypothetical protein